MSANIEPVISIRRLKSLASLGRLYGACAWPIWSSSPQPRSSMPSKSEPDAHPEKVKSNWGKEPRLLGAMLNAMAAYNTALPHWLDLYIAGLDAQKAHDRLFKAVAITTSKEFAMTALRARSLIPPPSEPLQNLRHETFARRIAEGHVQQPVHMQVHLVEKEIMLHQQTGTSS